MYSKSCTTPQKLAPIRIRIIPKNQGWGSAVIFCGSGSRSSCFSRCRSGSSFENFIKNLVRSFLQLKKTKNIAQKYFKKTMELVQICFENFNKIASITNFLAFFSVLILNLFFLDLYPRVKLMRIRIPSSARTSKPLASMCSLFLSGC